MTPVDMFGDKGERNQGVSFAKAEPNYSNFAVYTRAVQASAARNATTFAEARDHRYRPIMQRNASNSSFFRNDSPGDTPFVAGLASPRWMGAAAALILASGLFALAWLAVQVAAAWTGWDAASAVVIALGNGALTPALVLVPLAASSILVLRITHALTDRRRDRAAHGLESRAELIGALFSVVAVVVAGLVQPAAWSRVETIGAGIVALIIAAFAVTFAFFVGTVFAPDARVQLVADEAALVQLRQFDRAHPATEYPSTRRAALIVAVRGVVLLVAVPVGFGVWAAVGPSDLHEGLRTGFLTLSLCLMSAYAITLGQLSPAIRASGARRALVIASLLLGSGGWAFVAAFEVSGFLATRNAAWLAWALAFAGMGVVSAIGVLVRSTRGRWMLHAAVVSLRRSNANKRIIYRQKRVEDLQRLIRDSHPMVQALTALRAWLPAREARLQSSESPEPVPRGG